MINFIKSIFASLYPQRCAYCIKAIPSDTLACNECLEKLPRITGTICPKCGREKDVCSCKGAEMYYYSLCAPFYFKDNVRSGMHHFKFRNHPQNAEAYAIEMSKTIAERFSHVKFDCVTEVPMTAKSIKSRGYNQCSLLAEKIAEINNIEYKPGLLIKLYEIQKQHSLVFHLRKGNLTGVFDVTDPEYVSGKTILVVDDISTSGETLNECSKMLWLNDAKEVYCIAAALTQFEKNKSKK